MDTDLKIKTAEGKPPLDLLPLSALEGAARVFAYGAQKYAPGNYLLATAADGACSRYVAAALRHISAMQHPSGLVDVGSVIAKDPESTLPHIDHTICGLVMLRAILMKAGAL